MRGVRRLGLLLLLAMAQSGCAPAPVTVVAAGDLFVGGHFAGGLDLSVIGRADVRFANLEGPLVHGAVPGGLDAEGRPTGGVVTLAADPARAQWLANHLDVVSLANNHALDQGEAGLKETLVHLAAHGIAGVTADAPVSIRAGAQRISIVARHYLPNAPLAEAQSGELIAAVRAAKSRGPVLVSLHWGHTGSLLPSLEQRNVAHALVTAGASAVLGHGPHSPQGVECIDHSIVAYSLGNLAFGCQCTGERDAYLLQFTLRPSGAVEAASLRPLTAGLQQSPRLSNEASLAELLTDLSEDLGTTLSPRPDGSLSVTCRPPGAAGAHQAPSVAGSASQSSSVSAPPNSTSTE